MAARLTYLDREQVPPDVQTLFDSMKKATGRVLNIFRLMAYHPRSVAPFVAWYGTLTEGPLDLGLRQLAYVKASQLNHCNY
jgi:alkylhydroperoxidase family enzyme